MARIGLISDIHFGKFSRTKEFSVPGEPVQDETTGAVSLERGLINILKEKNVDYLFVAGDLTSVGSPQEFYYCQEKILKIAQEVGIKEDDIIYSLGNHDVDRKVADIWKGNNQGGEDIENEKPQELKDLIKKYYQIIAAGTAKSCMEKLKRPEKEGIAPCTGIVEKSEFIVFVLNSSWKCSGNQEYSHGVLTMEQIEWLKTVAEPYQKDPRRKIVLMHHHPIDYSYPTHIADISKVEEASELVDWAGKFGIDIILHGHRHHPWAKTCMETGWKNPISFICAGSLSVNAVHRGDVPNTFHVIEFDKSTEPIYLYNYVYSSSRGWEPVKESMPEVRLDARMYLGKAFTENEIEQAIKEFVGKTGEVKWESLPDCLKYLRIEELNDKFRSCLEGNTHIYGKFPNDIYCKGYEVL